MVGFKQINLILTYTKGERAAGSIPKLHVRKIYFKYPNG